MDINTDARTAKLGVAEKGEKVRAGLQIPNNPLAFGRGPRLTGLPALAEDGDTPSGRLRFISIREITLGVYKPKSPTPLARWRTYEWPARRLRWLRATLPPLPPIV